MEPKASLILVLVALSAYAVAQQHPSPAPTAAEVQAWDLLKSLEGSWTGSAVWDAQGKKGNAPFVLSYRATAGGKTVVETMLPDTPGEMITLYHLDGAELVATHYCTAGNQPRFRREGGTTPNVLSFRCAGGTNMSESDSHMHSVRLTLVDADHLNGVWTSKKGDVLQWEASAELARKK